MTITDLIWEALDARCARTVDRAARVWSSDCGNQKVIGGLVGEVINVRAFTRLGLLIGSSLACRGAVSLFGKYGTKYRDILKRLYPKSWKGFENTVDSLLTRCLQSFANDVVQLAVALSLASFLDTITPKLLPVRFLSYFHLCDFCYGMAHYRIKCSISIILPPIARCIVGLPPQGTQSEKQVGQTEAELGCIEFYIAESFLMSSKLIAGLLIRSVYPVEKPHIRRQSLMMLSGITFLTPLAHTYRQLGLKWYHVFFPILATFWQVLLKSGWSSVFSGIFYCKYYHGKGICGMIIPWAYLFMMSYEEMVRASEELEELEEEEAAAAAEAATHAPESSEEYFPGTFIRVRRGSYTVDFPSSSRRTSRTLLRSFTESKVLTDEDVAQLNNEVCIICQGDYEEERRTRHLTCGHFFHQNCADEWLMRHRICPLCRKDPVSSLTSGSVYSVEAEEEQEYDEEEAWEDYLL